MGAETYTTQNSTVTAPRAARPASATPAQRRTGPLSWTTGEAPVFSRATTAGDALPAPRLRQLMAVCGWAAVLGGIGLVIGIRGLIGVLSNSSPAWFEPTMILVGIAGIALTVGAFLTVQRTRAPFAFLGGASVVLVAAMVLTTQAF